MWGQAERRRATPIPQAYAHDVLYKSERYKRFGISRSPLRLWIGGTPNQWGVLLTMSGFLRSINRKVRWKEPRFIDGVAHYPIEGARVMERPNDGEVWTEHATVNGDIVLINGNEIKGHLGRQRAARMCGMYPELGDDLMLDTMGKHATTGHNRGYDDIRDVDEDIGPLYSVWVNELVYHADGHGGWVHDRPLKVDRYIVTHSQMGRRVGSNYDIESANTPQGFRRYVEDFGDVAYVYEWIEHPGKDMLDAFVQSVPAPPRVRSGRYHDRRSVA